MELRTLAESGRRWFEPAAAVNSAVAGSMEGRSRSDLTDDLESALRNSVNRRLLGDVPIGTACSGGLDSTLVTAMARDENPSIVAFNASLADESRADEARWAEIAAAGLGVELETVRVTAADWRGALVTAVAQHEYPLSGAASSVPVSLLARRARELGVKVLLTGEAADELFGAYTNVNGADFRSFLPARWTIRRLIEQARAPHRLDPIHARLLGLWRGFRDPPGRHIDLPASAAHGAKR